ncbi:hypothetical protein IAQ61_002653 [Plenodomus lingam]|uniref:uncharacterized protein n=1 Tax=Leptosphaeria maculans TaxID=5022 RepID=UPI003318E89C|nr:hypothetical protein IAQ61_002653 [Plenodomus lingam]
MVDRDLPTFRTFTSEGFDFFATAHRSGLRATACNYSRKRTAPGVLLRWSSFSPLGATWWIWFDNDTRKRFADYSFHPVEADGLGQKWARSPKVRWSEHSHRSEE